MSAWEHFNGPFNYNATPLIPLGCPVITHISQSLASPGTSTALTDSTLVSPFRITAAITSLMPKLSHSASLTLSTSIITTSPSRPSHQPTPLSTSLTPSPTPSPMLPQPQGTPSSMQYPLSATSSISGRNHAPVPPSLRQSSIPPHIGQQALFSSSFPPPPSKALYSSCSTATAASQCSKGAPHIFKGGITHHAT
jgi:hypothetical protein